MHRLGLAEAIIDGIPFAHLLLFALIEQSERADQRIGIGRDLPKDGDIVPL
ncbi:hypothetical protein CURE108131_25515 [Cupriavidus respiraculi]|uniref:Uncharacterized protein n=1 Tax=Cupriavidus respiraculi TaxID=195930 RepID=A0ABN7ZJP0_9BURK|nr:hypothetical protein LMG21510_05094 [Cupriavidus respiraculi]